MRVKVLSFDIRKAYIKFRLRQSMSFQARSTPLEQEPVGRLRIDSRKDGITNLQSHLQYQGSLFSLIFDRLSQ